MTTKTPKFNEALDIILKDLIPHERVCLECKKSFKVEKEDIDFYKTLRVPPPKLCPKCRQVRRISMLMRVPKFFKRPCTAPGHSENIVTVFPPSSPHKIYDANYWHSDAWDPASYGRQYDNGKRFFDQFKELFFDVPHLPLERDTTSLNSDYSLGGRFGKNNYYCAGGYRSEDCSFCLETRFSKLCVDCLNVWSSEFCYACVGSDHCNRCTFVIDSTQCLNSAFLYDCKNCTNCFLSSNLRNKSFVFENKQLTKEEYNVKLSESNLGDRKKFQEAISKFDEVFKNALHRSVLSTNAVNCVGDRVTNSKDCYFGFDGSEGENLRFSEAFIGAKDSMDSSYIAEDDQHLYETLVSTCGSNILFSLYIRVGINIEYSSECYNCDNCFGCVGLKNKKFHIFNKPYSEEDYWKQIDEIKYKMLNDGEYGELFPITFGLFPYQVCISQKFYPIDEATAKEKGIPWYDEPDSQIPQNIRLRDPFKEVPNNIKDVDGSILDDAIRCKITGRPFRIAAEELKFYRHMNLPVPTKHPWQRIVERFSFQHPVELFDFVCPNCGEKSFCIYNEEKQKQFRIFCEKCYVKEIV